MKDLFRTVLATLLSVFYGAGDARFDDK